MNHSLSEIDLAYLTMVREKLNLIDLGITLKGNAYDYGNTEKTLKKEMIEAFLYDATHDTQTYTYPIFAVFDALFENTQDYFGIINPLFMMPLSNWLKARVTFLIDQDGSIFLNSLEHAKNNADSDLFLRLLNLPINCSSWHSEGSYCFFQQVVDCLSVFYETNPQMQEEFSNAFVQFLKQSGLNVSDTFLINSYCKIFTNKNLNSFLTQLNRQTVNELYSEVQENIYGRLKINLKNLAMSELTIRDLKEISSINEAFSFPQFFITSIKEDYAFLAIEQSEPHAIEKIGILLEQLLQQNYNWQNDSKHIQYHDITNQINEKFHLEATLNQHLKESIKRKI
jgi:hypothetical protein